MRTRTWLATTFGILLAANILSAPSLAQETKIPEEEDPFQYKRLAGGYFTVGECIHDYKLVGVGGSAEEFMWRGITLGADFSYQKFVEDETGFGTASLLIGYHFGDRKSPGKFDPFVNFSPFGAYFTGDGGAAIASFGGGVNYWFKERIGLHTAVRFTVLGYEEGTTGFNVGVVFR